MMPSILVDITSSRLISKRRTEMAMRLLVSRLYPVSSQSHNVGIVTTLDSHGLVIEPHVEELICHCPSLIMEVCKIK